MSEKLSKEVRHPDLAESSNWEDSEDNPSSNLLRRFKKIIEEQGVALNQGIKILEVGSGDGRLVKLMEKEGMDVVGVDARPRNKIKSGNEVAARIELLPFADNTFSVVVAHKVFDVSAYEQDSYQMFREIYRVLKKGGIFINSIADRGSPKEVVPWKLVSTGNFTDVYKKE